VRVYSVFSTESDLWLSGCVTCVVAIDISPIKTAHLPCPVGVHSIGLNNEYYYVLRGREKYACCVYYVWRLNGERLRLLIIKIGYCLCYRYLQVWWNDRLHGL